MSEALVQSGEYAEALRICGGRPRWHSHRLLLRRRLAGVPLTLASRVGHIDRDWIAGLPPGPVILNPDEDDGVLAQAGAVQVMTPATEVLWTLGDTNSRRARLHGKWRNQLRAAEATRLKLVETPLPPEVDHWLFRMDAHQQKRNGYRNWPARLTCAFAHLHGPKCHLFTVEEDGLPLAAMLFLRHGRRATYHIGVGTDAGRRCNAHRLLLWDASERLARRGVEVLDLGLIDTEVTPGLARFKLGTGARARRLGGTWLWWPPMARIARPALGSGQVSAP